MTESEELARPTLPELLLRLRAFAQARDWERFHTPKNLVTALAVEAAELMEPFQWLTPEEADALCDDPVRRDEVAGELADVAMYLIRLSDVLDIDLTEAILRKLERNEVRFPVDKVRGRARPPKEWEV